MTDTWSQDSAKVLENFPAAPGSCLYFFSGFLFHVFVILSRHS